MAQYHARDRGGDYQSDRLESLTASKYPYAKGSNLIDSTTASKSAELHKDSSDFVDSSENNPAFANKAKQIASLPSLRGQRQKQSICDSTENDFKDSIDCLVPNGFYDDDFIVDCHDSATQNLAMTPPLPRLFEAKPKQSINTNISAESTAKLLESPKDSTHSKPRLLHLASDLHSGGAERVFYNTIEQTLETNSYEIFIASADKAIPFNIDKSHFLRLDDWSAYSKVRGVCKYIFNLRNYRLLKRFLFTHKIDIIHTQNYLSRLSPSVLFALRKFKREFPQTRLIFTQHGYGVCANLCLYNYAKNAICESCIGKSKLRIAIDNCDRRGRIYSFLKALRVPFYQGVFLKEQNLFDKIIFVSEFQGKKHILEGYKSTAVIANPIEHRFYNPHIKAQDKQNLIVFFGRIAKEKNIPLLIRSFVRFAKTHKDYRLLIIGNGDEKEKCQRLAEELLVAESQEDSMKSNAKSPESSLRDSTNAESCVATATHSYLQIHSSLPSLRGSEATEAIHLNSFRNSDFKNMIDSSEAKTSRNDGDFTLSHDSTTPNLTMTEKDDSIESTKIDSLESQSNSRNDGIGAFPQQSIESRNDDSPLPSLRGSEATEAIHLNSFRNSDSKNFIDSHSLNGLYDNDSTMDCHDSTTQNLAMTDRDASINPANLINPTNPTASQIDFISHLPPDELKEILKLAKITVLPSLLYETFGLSIVESVLSGAVPIVSNIGALSETIERYYGVAFKNGDEISLANAMEAVVCEYERHFQALLQARSKIISDIECKKYVSDLLNAYML